MKKSLFYSLILFSLLACGGESIPDQSNVSTESIAVSNIKAFQLQEGDLLFQDSDCGSFCDAIEKVTFGINGAKLSHVGMLVKDKNQKLVVLEAISEGVVKTDMDTFLNRSSDKNGNPKVLVGRLNRDYQSLIRPAIQSAMKNLGKAYDEDFDITNDKFYCSELIYFAFKEANEGTPIFQLRAMTYKDPATKATFPVWAEYFQEKGTEIPEGKAGLNPGSMSRSLYLSIVHAYGNPDGYSDKSN